MRFREMVNNTFGSNAKITLPAVRHTGNTYLSQEIEVNNGYSSAESGIYRASINSHRRHAVPRQELARDNETYRVGQTNYIILLLERFEQSECAADEKGISLRRGRSVNRLRWHTRSRFHRGSSVTGRLHRHFG